MPVPIQPSPPSILLEGMPPNTLAEQNTQAHGIPPCLRPNIWPWNHWTAYVHPSGCFRRCLVLAVDNLDRQCDLVLSSQAEELNESLRYGITWGSEGET